MRDRLLPLLERAAGRADTRGRGVLVSVTEHLPPVDPLDVLEEHTTSQMFWAVPRDAFELAGLGAAVSLEAKGDARFADVGRAWAQLRDDAIVDGPVDGFAGAGPVLMGGFAFEPEGPRSGRWNGFPSARFAVPQVAVARRGAACRLTLSALVEEDADVDALAAELCAERQRVVAIANSPGRRARSAAAPGMPVPADDPRAATAWHDMVARAVDAIHAGTMEKVVLAREVQVSLPSAQFDALAALRHLREVQQNAFVFGIWHDDALFFGATPERLVRVRGQEIETSVLAGSAPRGGTPEEDAARASGLRRSAKDREEHEIVRRDIHALLGDVCASLTSPAEPSLVTLPSVHHLHTAVRGRLRDGRTVFDVVERLHPTPALGGSPREAALRFLREHEHLDRGWYAAPVGWVDDADAEFAVGLRSALVRRASATVYAGCGIVAQSTPAEEYAESALKLATALDALAQGAGGRHG